MFDTRHDFSSRRIVAPQLVCDDHARDVAQCFQKLANTAKWTARQIAEAFPWDSAPRYLLHDRDCVYGAAFHPRWDGETYKWLDESLSINDAQNAASQLYS